MIFFLGEEGRLVTKPRTQLCTWPLYLRGLFTTSGKDLSCNIREIANSLTVKATALFS